MPVNVTTTVPVNFVGVSPSWTDTGVVMAPGDTLYFTGTGTAHTGVNTNNVACNAGGSVIPIAGDAAAYGYYCAIAGVTVQTAGTYSLVFALRQDGSGAPAERPVTDAFCAGYNMALAHTNGAVTNQRVWAQFNGFGIDPYKSEITGGPYYLNISDGTPTGSPSPLTSCQPCCDTPPSVVLNWASVALATGFEIRRDGVLIDTVGAVLTYTDTNVSALTNYDYAVRGINGGGHGPDATLSVRVHGFVTEAPVSCTFTAEAPVTCVFTTDACTCH